MKEIWIVEAEAVTGLGDSLDDLWTALKQGKSSIDTVERFDTSSYISNYASIINGLDLKNNADSSRADESMITGLLSRLSSSINPLPNDCAIITATTKAGIDIFDKRSKCEDNSCEALYLPGLPRHAARQFGGSQNGFNVSSACASSTAAIAICGTMIKTSMIDAALVVCADLVTEFVFSGFSSLKALSGQPCQPFDKARSGLTLGEGAGALLLMDSEKAIEQKRECKGVLAGWGMASDAAHITAPARDGRGLLQAMTKALEMAGISKAEIAGIVAHGTGTVYNDAMEMTAFNSFFDNAPPPAYSIKGSIGHTLGAAGGIETAVCLKILEDSLIPGTCGFITPEDDAKGLIASKNRRINGNAVMTTNSGFGGTNAALIISNNSKKKAGK